MTKDQAFSKKNAIVEVQIKVITTTFVSLSGAQIWRPKAKKTYVIDLCYEKPIIVF